VDAYPDSTCVGSAEKERVGAGVAGTGAEHEAFDPPFDPAQVQDQGPDPETVEAVPAEQRFTVGLDTTVTPFAKPQTPFWAQVVPFHEYPESQRY